MKSELLVAFILIAPLTPMIAEKQGDENPYDRSLEPSKSFHEAREFVETKQFAEAYAVHQRMFSNIKDYRPNVFFLTVYNLTYDWHRAAEEYPPAMKGLLEYRDRLEKRLQGLHGGNDEPSIEDRIAVRTVFSFGEWLGEDERSADLFDSIEVNYPGLADGMYFHCKDALIRAGRFATIVKYEPDPAGIADRAAAVFTVTIKARPDLESMATKRFETDIVKCLDAFSALGKNIEMERLRKLALNVVSSERIRQHLPWKNPNGG